MTGEVFFPLGFDSLGDDLALYTNIRAPLLANPPTNGLVGEGANEVFSVQVQLLPNRGCFVFQDIKRISAYRLDDVLSEPFVILHPFSAIMPEQADRFADLDLVDAAQFVLVHMTSNDVQVEFRDLYILVSNGEIAASAEL